MDISGSTRNSDPTSPDPAKNLHVFDRAITRSNPDDTSGTNCIDLYKARHFVCECKQGVSASETNVASVYDRRANEEALSLSSSGIDSHRPTLQADLADTETSSQSPITHPQSTIHRPDRLPDQVAILRKLINTGDRNVAAPYDA